MSWWTNATTEQRLAQIDGGISVGMSARQIAVNLGANANTVQSFGNRYGRSFTAHSERGDGGVQSHMAQRRNAGIPETLARYAFQIFENTSHGRSFEMGLLDEVM